MSKIKIDDDGCCRCGKCGHKLFKVQDISSSMLLTLVELEIKCHLCKAINNFKEEEK